MLRNLSGRRHTAEDVDVDQVDYGYDFDDHVDYSYDVHVDYGDDVHIAHAHVDVVDDDDDGERN